MINGLSWPATERLVYRRGEVVRWRVINLSSQRHPMHLHGFYFTVMQQGNGRRDEPVAKGQGARVVTHLLSSSGTVSLEGTPEREGNWLFHCHIMSHVSPSRRLGAFPPSPHALHGAHHNPAGPDTALGMAGMVMGITVLPSDAGAKALGAAVPRRQITMVIGGERRSTNGAPTLGVAIDDGQTPGPAAPANSPGPPLVLRRASLSRLPW